MSTLVLVRHAQSATFEEDSDRLTLVGERQARALGEFWRQRGVRFDEAYCGEFTRHRQTAELAGFSQYIATSDFNEYDAGGILRSAGVVAPPKDNRELQTRFDALMPQWLAGTLQSPDIESWRGFSGRVRRAIRNIIGAEGTSRRVVVFTSGGPIGLTVQTVVGAPDAMALELNWRIRNCSLTEFVFSGGRISLDSFNATPHLNEVTFR